MSFKDIIMENGLLAIAKEDELKNMNNNEIIKELESLFLALKNLNYPDCDILTKAGCNLKYNGCDIDEFVVNYLNLASTSFDEALIYWFLYAYWQDKKDSNQRYTQLLFDKAKNMKENPDYGNRTACLLVFAQFLDIKLLYKEDAKMAIEVIDFLRKEFEELSKSEKSKKERLYSDLKKIIKDAKKYI